MKTIFKTLALIIPLVVLTSAIAVQTYTTLKTTKMTVSGTSSLHDWTSEVTKLEWKGTVITQENSITEVKNLEVKIPVTAIKSTKGKIMDNKTYEAFNHEKYPSIIYQLSTLTVSANGTENILNATGTLTMAGVKNNITMKVTGKLLPNGGVQLTGSHKLNMRTFKMEPPTAMMGTIKVGEEVTVNFDLILQP